MRIGPRTSAISFLLGWSALDMASAQRATVHPVELPGVGPLHAREDSVAGFRYLTFVTGNARPGDRLPLIVGLHHSGASPETILGDFEGIDVPARVILPQGGFRAGPRTRSSHPSTERWIRPRSGG